jgi:hypothetical protein
MPKPSTGRWVGVGVLAFGAGLTALRWWGAAPSTEGILEDVGDGSMRGQLRLLGLVGPFLAGNGVAVLVLPRAWFGQEGKLRLPAGWRPFLATVGLGLLFVAVDVLLLERFERRWGAARRTHRACGEELVRLSEGYTEVLAGIRDQASARKAEGKLRGYARWARRLRDRTASLGPPTQEEKEWLGEVMMPALMEQARKRGRSPPAFTTPEVDRLVSQISSDLLESLYDLGREQFEEALEALEKRKPKP